MTIFDPSKFYMREFFLCSVIHSVIQEVIIHFYVVNARILNKI